MRAQYHYLCKSSFKISYPSMVNTAKSILENQRSLKQKSLMSIKDILNLIPES